MIYFFLMEIWAIEIIPIWNKSMAKRNRRSWRTTEKKTHQQKTNNRPFNRVPVHRTWLTFRTDLTFFHVFDIFINCFSLFVSFRIGLKIERSTVAVRSFCSSKSGQWIVNNSSVCNLIWWLINLTDWPESKCLHSLCDRTENGKWNVFCFNFLMSKLRLCDWTMKFLAKINKISQIMHS